MSKKRRQLVKILEFEKPLNIPICFKESILIIYLFFNHS